MAWYFQPVPARLVPARLEAGRYYLQWHRLSVAASLRLWDEAGATERHPTEIQQGAELGDVSLTRRVRAHHREARQEQCAPASRGCGCGGWHARLAREIRAEGAWRFFSRKSLLFRQDVQSSEFIRAYNNKPQDVQCPPMYADVRHNVRRCPPMSADVHRCPPMSGFTSEGKQVMS